MGQILTALDDNFLAVVGNFRKLQKSWVRLTRILGREGASPRVSGTFFKEFVQAVIIFGLEAWVMNPCIGRALGGFQHRVSRRINGRQPKRQVDGIWEYPPQGEVRGDVIICPEEAEYGRTTHCDATDYGHIKGDGADARGVGC